MEKDLNRGYSERLSVKRTLSDERRLVFLKLFFDVFFFQRSQWIFLEMLWDFYHTRALLRVCWKHGDIRIHIIHCFY